jgi:phage-related protein
MAVSNIYNSLSFGGVNSADYGIYITGEAVYNAPKRVVNMVDVPGRNGAIAIDQGRWENIEIEYPAGTFGMTEAEFRTAVSDFRNAICSQIGYQRLTDTYHPDEYRMALYVEGLEVEPAPRQQAGEFTLKFNCKPQRWLANGETAIVVASGDTLTNPTPYDAGPLLAVEGYGTIGFNGYTIELTNETMGEITLASSGSGLPITFTQGLLNTGDTINIDSIAFYWAITPKSGYEINTTSNPPTVTDSYSGADSEGTVSTKYSIKTDFPNIRFTYGTAQTISNTASARVNLGSGGSTVSRVQCVQNIIYDGAEQISLTWTLSVTSGGTYVTASKTTRSYTDVMGDSTVSLLGHPTYIDCEIGEAYKVENDEYISLNAYIALGSDLPILKSGANEITLDNTITELKVKSNWWRL